MPYCPECRRKYREGFSICADCGCELAQHLEAESGNEFPERQTDTPHEEWVPLARLQSRHYAEMVKEGLKAKGIPAAILNRGGYIGDFGLQQFTSGDYLLMVPREFVVDADKEAETILGDVWEESKVYDIE